MAASRNFPTRKEVEARLDALGARIPERRSKERPRESERDQIEMTVRLHVLEARLMAGEEKR